MDKPQIVGLGLNGLVGSRIVELIGDRYEFVSLSRETGVDITKPETLTSIKNYPQANFVLHLAAKADVEGCEEDKSSSQQGDAWRINVEGTKNVAEICRETGKKIIYISTDFVFDGEKPKGESYSEEDRPNPINWYGETKYRGEKAIEASGADYAIVRLAYPYRAKFEAKKDFMRAIKDRLIEGLPISAVIDHIFCPTFIDDFAYALDKLIETDATGIYHVVGSQALTPYDSAMKIAEAFGLSAGLISRTTREEFFKNRALRPFNLMLTNDKIKQLGVEIKGFDKGLHAIKSQIQ
jgi:dTDP-4-dehydrorhamnose reductase